MRTVPTGLVIALAASSPEEAITGDGVTTADMVAPAAGVTMAAMVAQVDGATTAMTDLDTMVQDTMDPATTALDTTYVPIE